MPKECRENTQFSRYFSLFLLFFDHAATASWPFSQPGRYAGMYDARPLPPMTSENKNYGAIAHRKHSRLHALRDPPYGTVCSPFSERSPMATTVRPPPAAPRAVEAERQHRTLHVTRYLISHLHRKNPKEEHAHPATSASTLKINGNCCPVMRPRLTPMHAPPMEQRQLTRLNRIARFGTPIMAHVLHRVHAKGLME